MSDQLALDLGPLTEPTYTPDLSLSERYELFRAANPHVLRAFEVLTAQWLAAGHARVGIKSVAERIRWESGIQTTGDPWRINNSFVSLIARDLIALHPEWAEAIETRRLRAA